MDPFHPTPPVMPGTQDSPGQPPWCLWVGEWVSGPVCVVDTSLGCLPLAGLLLHQPVQSLRGLVRPVGLVYDRTEPSGTAFLLGRVRNWQACVLVSWRQGWNDSTVSLCHLLSPVTAPVPLVALRIICCTTAVITCSPSEMPTATDVRSAGTVFTVDSNATNSVLATVHGRLWADERATFKYSTGRPGRE